MHPNQIAINSISTGAAPLEQTLAAYAAAGFKNVEFPLGRLKEWIAPARTIADLRKLLDTYGLKMIGGFEQQVYGFAPPDPLAANHAVTLANARLIAELGGGTLVAGTDGPQHPSLDALDSLGRVIAKLVDQFPAAVSLAIEFNWSPFVKSLRSADRVVAAADHPRVGILFDPAHYYCTPSRFEDLTPSVVARIKHVHVNDMRDKPGDQSHCNSDRLLPGQGILNLPRLLGRLEEHGYKGYFSLEMFNEDLWKVPVPEAARMCYQSMLALCA